MSRLPRFDYAPQQTDAELAASDLIRDAAHNLLHAFRELAPAEALTRALVHERTEQRGQARFWAEVYTLCTDIQASASLMPEPI